MDIMYIGLGCVCVYLFVYAQTHIETCIRMNSKAIYLLRNLFIFTKCNVKQRESPFDIFLTWTKQILLGRD